MEISLDVSRYLIKESRLRRGLTQSELAALAGTSQSAIASYEAGRKSPTMVTLVRILGAVGLELRTRLVMTDSHDRQLEDEFWRLPRDQRQAIRKEQRRARRRRPL